MTNPTKHLASATGGTGETLFNIYRNLFPTDSDDGLIKDFQLKAARYFDGPAAQEEFRRLLRSLNGDVDPGLSEEQILTFAYFMKMDQNAFTVTPWDLSETGSQMW